MKTRRHFSHRNKNKISDRFLSRSFPRAFELYLLNKKSEANKSIAGRSKRRPRSSENPNVNTDAREESTARRSIFRLFAFLNKLFPSPHLFRKKNICLLSAKQTWPRKYHRVNFVFVNCCVHFGALFACACFAIKKLFKKNKRQSRVWRQRVDWSVTNRRSAVFFPEVLRTKTFFLIKKKSGLKNLSRPLKCAPRSPTVPIEGKCYF